MDTRWKDSPEHGLKEQNPSFPAKSRPDGVPAAIHRSSLKSPTSSRSRGHWIVPYIGYQGPPPAGQNSPWVRVWALRRCWAGSIGLNGHTHGQELNPEMGSERKPATRRRRARETSSKQAVPRHPDNELKHSEYRHFIVTQAPTHIECVPNTTHKPLT